MESTPLVLERSFPRAAAKRSFCHAQGFPGPALPHSLPSCSVRLHVIAGLHVVLNCREAHPTRGSDTVMPPGAFYQKTELSRSGSR